MNHHTHCSVVLFFGERQVLMIVLIFSLSMTVQSTDLGAQFHQRTQKKKLNETHHVRSVTIKGTNLVTYRPMHELEQMEMY